MDSLTPTQRVNNFVAITLLSAMNFKTDKDLYIFAEIDEDHCFGIVEEDVDISGMYADEMQETFDKWHQIANEIFLRYRADLIRRLENE